MTTQLETTWKLRRKSQWNEKKKLNPQEKLLGKRKKNAIWLFRLISKFVHTVWQLIAVLISSEVNRWRRAVGVWFVEFCFHNEMIVTPDNQMWEEKQLLITNRWKQQQQNKKKTQFTGFQLAEFSECLGSRAHFERVNKWTGTSFHINVAKCHVFFLLFLSLSAHECEWVKPMFNLAWLPNERTFYRSIESAHCFRRTQAQSAPYNAFRIEPYTVRYTVQCMSTQQFSP